MKQTCFSQRNVLGRIALAGLCLTVLPACAQILGVDPDPVRGEAQCSGTLRVRITTDATGLSTDVAPPYNHGIYDYLRYLNDTKGGLRGCPIDVDVQDAKYDTVETQKIIDAWRQEPDWSEVSTLFIFGTGPTKAVAPKLMEEKKLIIPGSYAGMFTTPSGLSLDVSYPEVSSSGEMIPSTERKVSDGYPYLFFPATDYSTAIRIGIQAAWKVKPGRIAMVHDTEANCNFCVDPLAAGKSYVQMLPGMSLGPDLVIAQTSDASDESVITGAVKTYIQNEITKKKANSSYDPVRWLWAGNSVVSSTLIAKGAAEAQKIIDDASLGEDWKVRVMANNWGIGETSSTICMVNGPPSCANVLYGLFPVPRYGDVQNAEGMLAMMKMHDDYRAKDGQPTSSYQDVRYVQGYAAALMWQKAVEKALDDGHPSPTGEDLKNALETFKDVDLEGMTAGRISFTPKDHRPQANTAVYKINSQSTLEFVDRYSIMLSPDWLGY